MLKRYMQYFTKQTKRTQQITAGLVIIVVAGIGTYLLTLGHAASPYASITADSGSLASGASKQTCTSASDGSCVVFGGSVSNKIIGINGTFYDSNYDYTLNAVQMGAQWYRDDVWGDDAHFETTCSAEFDYSADNNCGTQVALNTIAKNGLHMLLLLNPNPTGTTQAVDFVLPGTCSTSSDYSTCLSSCSSPTYTGTCMDQLGWVQAAVYTAYNYGYGGTFWQGRTNLGSQFMEIGNEVYNPLEPSGNGPWSCVYDTVTVNGTVYNECFDPGDYAEMVKLVGQAVNTATNGRVKVLFDSEPYYTTDTEGDSGNWPQAMQAAVPDLASDPGIDGVTLHPYGDIPSIGVCANNPCSTSGSFSYPNNLDMTHQSWPTLPVYVTEVGQETSLVGTAGQCKAINQYFDDLRNNSWEAGLWIFSQQGNETGGYDLIQGPDNQPYGGGTLEPGWYAYQSQALHQTDYGC